MATIKKGQTKAPVTQKTQDLKAQAFIQQLNAYQSDKEREKILRYFKKDNDRDSANDEFIGVRMGDVFALAKTYTAMDIQHIEKLLESNVHEIRAGAVSIMDFKARDKKTTAQERKAIFDLYISRHDRINDWDLVDRAAPWVVGGYLYDKPRNILYKLARSKNKWERRTAIVSTFYFIRKNDTTDTFKIAEILVHDKEDLVQKAVGGWIRAAGDKAPAALRKFLDQYAATMPRTMLRYAIEKLSVKEKAAYMKLKQAVDKTGTTQKKPSR